MNVPRGECGMILPQEDSIPGRAVAYLKTVQHGQWVSTRHLAGILGVDPKNLNAVLKPRVKNGEIVRREKSRKDHEGRGQPGKEWKIGVKSEARVTSRGSYTPREKPKFKELGRDGLGRIPSVFELAKFL